MPRWRYEAVAMSPGPMGALRRAVEALGVEPTELPSGAGHDAAILALAGRARARCCSCAATRAA